MDYFETKPGVRGGEDGNGDDKEGSQSQIYGMLEQLQGMHQEIPENFQQRIPNELLSSLASALVQGQIFEIVQVLNEVQLATEKQLFQQRLQLLKTQSEEKQEFHRHYQHTICNAQNSADDVLRLTKELDAHLDRIKKKHGESLRHFDMKLILQLDQKVSDQQVTLERAGVPGFHVSNDPHEIQLQMYILDFIRRLYGMQPNKGGVSR